MLQQLPYQDQPLNEAPANNFLTRDYIYGVIKRRWIYFVIPTALLFGIGAVITVLLPATYVSEGKMLIESQEIPTTLVQPTVSTVADERVALLQQRIMVRDKLLAIATKYKLAELARHDEFLGRWLAPVSDTDIVDMMRKRTQIAAVKNELQGAQNQRPFIAFTVSFENERPAVARQVANELVTVILDEDVRSRTSSATETTRFLETETKRLTAQLDALDIKIVEAKNREIRTPDGPSAESQLAMLKTELLLKSATYSATHPDIKALKDRIAVMQKLVSGKATDRTASTEAGLDALQRQRDSTAQDLQLISGKLAAARLGENLERGQHSERLSVLEQPTMPQKPVRPNRPKLLATFAALAIAAGGGLAFAFEMLDDTIRRNADIAKLIDSQLIVSIPYITTKAETVRNKSRKIWFVLAVSLCVLLVGAVAAIYLSRKLGLFLPFM
jgi:uncharacterized protein involved in exopolysaccharide biosynthesis